jgi:hypothetical protein
VCAGIRPNIALAAEAGLRMLHAGGNAIDAAVAATLVEGVVNPHMHTFGGELSALIYTAHDRRVLVHVMKNAAPSVMALMGLQLGYLLGGSILVETVFNWPGSGGLMNLAIFRRDVPVLSATILAIAALFVLINIAVDVLQAAVDPGSALGGKPADGNAPAITLAGPEPRLSGSPARVLEERLAARVPGQGDDGRDPDPLRHRRDVGAARGAMIRRRARCSSGSRRRGFPGTGSARMKSGATCGRAWSTAGGSPCSAGWCPCSWRS